MRYLMLLFAGGLLSFITFSQGMDYGLGYQPPRDVERCYFWFIYRNELGSKQRFQGWAYVSDIDKTNMDYVNQGIHINWECEPLK